MNMGGVPNCWKRAQQKEFLEVKMVVINKENCKSLTISGKILYI